MERASVSNLVTRQANNLFDSVTAQIIDHPLVA
jgi:hypothetical protein